MISACVHLSVFPYCHTFSAQQSYFYFSPVYWVHLSCFCKHRSVALYIRTPYTLQWRFSKCWIVESNPVGAWVLLKLYISTCPILVIHCSPWTNHSLSPHKTCNYHHHSCSTQQLFYEVEIICFSLFFMTQQTVMMLVSLAGQLVYSTTTLRSRW